MEEELWKTRGERLLQLGGGTRSSGRRRNREVTKSRGQSGDCVQGSSITRALAHSCLRNRRCSGGLNAAACQTGPAWRSDWLR